MKGVDIATIIRSRLTRDGMLAAVAKLLNDDINPANHYTPTIQSIVIHVYDLYMDPVNQSMDLYKEIVSYPWTMDDFARKIGICAGMTLTAAVAAQVCLGVGTQLERLWNAIVKAVVPIGANVTLWGIPLKKVDVFKYFPQGS